MTDPIQDADVRQQALDPTHSFIVQAPAGSGKTELLMQRYLTLLTRVNAPEEIIAITFTKKATGEMRERIVLALDHAAHADEPEQAHARQTWALAREVLKRDRDLDWQIRLNPNRLRIHTIDALCASLARQMPIVSAMGVSPAVVNDASDAYQEAARACLRDLPRSEDIALLLVHLDNNWSRLESMLISLLARRDHWLRHIPAQSQADVLETQRKNLHTSLGDLIEDTLQRVDRAIPDAVKQSWLMLADFAGSNLQRDASTSPLTHCIAMENWPTTDAAQLPIWRGLLDVILTGSNTFRKRLTIKDGFPTSKDKAEKAEFDALKQQCFSLIETVAEEPGLLPLLASIRILPNPAYNDEQWAVLKALFNVLKLAVAQLRVVFSQQAQVDFTEISLAALHALGDENAPSDLALSLDYRLQHLLVDEFQDTSVSQYTLLERLTQGWQDGDGRSLFLVGDPMQSIYRFREAEVGLFLNVQGQQRLGQVPITPLKLIVNFRSNAGVVNWVNQTFIHAMPAIDSVTQGAVSYSRSEAFKPIEAGEAVSITPLLDAADEELHVCKLAAAALAREESVVVLVRGRSHLLRILPALREQGLPYQAVEIESLAQRPVIRDLTALTRALWHLADRVAWLSILRAPWCGLTLADLEILSAKPHRALYEALQDPAVAEQLSEDGKARILRILPVLTHAIENRYRQPFARWVALVWRDLNGPECLQEAIDHDNAQRFFSLLAELEEARDLMDLSCLDQAVAKLYALPQTVNGPCVQLMSIHKSKGLEFDTVIIPGMERMTRTSEAQLLQWTEWRNTQRDQEALLLAPIEQTGADKEPINRYLADLEKNRDRHETVRLLYVAATRAKRQLHLIASVKQNDEGELKQPDARSLIATIWPSIEEYCKARVANLPMKNDAPMEVESTYIPQLFRLPIDQLSTQATISSTSPQTRDHTYKSALADRKTTVGEDQDRDWRMVEARHAGIVVHRLLQQLADAISIGSTFDETIDQLNRCSALIRHLLLESGLNPSALNIAEDIVQRSLKAIAEDDRARWIFSASHQSPENEYALSGVLDEGIFNGVIDRTFIDEKGVRWIIDYKTAQAADDDVEGFLDIQQAQYQEQLARYAAMFQQLETRPIKLALYFPLSRAWRSWAWEGVG